MIIWRFIDGKPGHENQTTGLIGALRKSLAITVIDIPVNEIPIFPILLLCWLIRKKPTWFPSQPPDLIIGAGRKTHLPMVIAKSIAGGKLVVLMRPSLPFKWFDLVVVPKHDGLHKMKEVFETVGVLNGVQFENEKDSQLGLILIGGESAHYDWNSNRVISQIEAIVHAEVATQWVLTTSRRTPSCFMTNLVDQLDCPNLSVVPFEETNQQWMADHYSKSGQIWVSPDSVSMVYESLSSGAATAVFYLDPKNEHGSRVRQGLDSLISEGSVLTFDQWEEDTSCQHKPCFLNEASRVAAYILEHL